MIKTFFKILSLGAQYKYWMILAALMSFFTVGSGIGLMMTSSFIIASAAIQTPIYQLQVAIVGVRFFGISRGVFRYLERYISHEVTFKLLAKFRVWFFKSLEPLIPSKKKDLTSGDLLSRAIEDIESLEHIFVRVISPPFVFVAVAILMFTLLNLFNLKYAVIFLTTFVLSAIGIPTLTYFLSHKIGVQIIKLKSQLKAIAVDSIQGLPELIVYGQIQKWKNIFSEIEDKLLRLEGKMNLIQSLHEVLTGLAMNITVAIMLYAAIPDVTNKLLNGVYLSVITIGIMASFEIVFQIPLAFQYLTKSVEAGKRLLEITETEQINNLYYNPNLEHRPTTYPEYENQEIKKYDLKINDLTFSYDEHKKALDKISFEVKEREKIAIVGASGSGKSTLVNVICKLWNY
ncbi:MAG: amino acid ABC transporter ATP-binding/permease protein, partial [Ignavibacterium sp.]